MAGSPARQVSQTAQRYNRIERRSGKMPSEDIKAPGRKSLLTAAAAAVLMAGIVLSYGFIGRAQSKQEVVDWTNTHAIPTVALAARLTGSSHHTLTLPGN